MKNETKPTHLLELDAMKRIHKVLDPLPAESKRRVVEWITRAVTPEQGGK